ncbi:hypothetical protein N7474_000631 [Penicillium riverlandense]|uniref:uncharacterized protein n=1 Tax=Penicillium riverlandense TaxID=1903569 RepID=UPI002549BEC1|nr:uncharacterized protein N7474_000631 [Penicillium riverlandense]KAJ5832320.1 hypothetical protein N7474_000631 [Penicillium riverlandense]
MQTKIKHAQLGQINAFYREAGDHAKPVILLLHGFPSSSHQYRNLIPLLSASYWVLAPDLPGFGFTTVPYDYKYTFENLATFVGDFLDHLRIDQFSVYIFDYGAPTALRLALQRPSSITAIISQNGNAYEEGLGGFWDLIKPYWQSNNPRIREKLRLYLLSYDTTKFQYVTGSPDPESIPPETYLLDYTLLSRPGIGDIQMDLIKDYQKNIPLYPQFQNYLRSSQVPLLAVWGKDDPIFIPPGAEAFQRDLPNAEIHLLDAGHFALETHLESISDLILEFLQKNLRS